MPTIIPTDRHQLTFLNSLDDMVAADHSIRLLDLLIDRIIEQDPAFFNHLATQGSDGRPGYSAAALIKLFLYGYIHGINSSRKLEAEATRNIEVIWLLSGLKPCYKTIANYRKNHPDQIKRINEQVVRFLVDHRWIRGKQIGIDGTKLKAYTGWNIYDDKDIAKQLKEAHNKLEQWLTTLTANDLNDELAQEHEGLEEGDFEDRTEVMDEIDRLHRKIARLEELKEELQRQGCSKISATDPDARIMRQSRGGKIPAYNLQISVDQETKMIALASITQQQTDFQQLTPMYWATVERLGRIPERVLADTGYADLGDIKEIENQTDTICYIPENNSPVTNRPITFTFQPDTGQYRCSQGKALKAVGKPIYRKDKQAYLQKYRGTECKKCEVAGICTSSKSGIRSINVSHGAQWRYQYDQRLKSRKAKECIKQRKALVEHPFGTLKYWMGQIPLKLRGLRKVQAEIDIYSCGYNIKRWLNEGSFTFLMDQLTSWNPKPETSMA